MQERFFLLYGGNALDKYVVKLYARAYQDLNCIYTCIAKTLLEPGTALDISERGTIRHIGASVSGNYRQVNATRH